MTALDEKARERLVRHRKAARLTQAELAEQVGVQPETISRIETGERGISVELGERLSEVLALDLAELFHPSQADDEKGLALESLLLFASRLTPAEIRLVIDVGADVLSHVRRTRAQ